MSNTRALPEDQKAPIKVRRHHLRVPVTEVEATSIQAYARASGLSVASYLRKLGLGHTVTSILDLERVTALSKVNADLGRLGGLLKLWLTNDERTAQFGEATILALLAKIEANQTATREVIATVLRKGGK